MSNDDLSPQNLPFSAYMRERLDGPAVESAYTVLECIAMAKRMLLQERVREFTAADVVALAAIIESRDREFMLHRLRTA